jgi:GT2 family glycosyltransferase
MVSILILNYNSKGLLGPLLVSLAQRLPDKGWECVIRDNSDNMFDFDECAPLIKIDGRFKWFQKKNEGNFSSMNNEMIEFCKGEKLLFLNNDMIAVTDFLTPMLELLEVPNMGVVGACLVYPDHSKEKGNVQHCGVAFDQYKVPHNLRARHFEEKQLNGAFFCFHDRYFQAVTGACLLIRKEDFLKVGGFCDDYNWCYDDVDLCLRVRYGLKKDCAVAMRAGLIHIENWTVRKNKSSLSPKHNVALDSYKLLMSRWEPFIVKDMGLYQADYGRVRR